MYFHGLPDSMIDGVSNDYDKFRKAFRGHKIGIAK
jgi:hypothetical protein